jgi:glycosyltransferase involved in cell wall biosynthesis
MKFALSPLLETCTARRVLMLAYAFPPENQPGAARPFRFFRYLPDFGYLPLVITASPQPHPVPGVHVVSNRTDTAGPRSLLRLTNAVVSKFVTPQDPGLIWARDATLRAESLHAEAPAAVVFSTFPPLHTHLACLLISRKLRLPWIADFRDPLLGNPFRRRSGLPKLFDRYMENSIFRNASALIGVADRMVDEWRVRSPWAASKMHVLWNGFDPADPVRAVPSPPRTHRILAHIGAIYGARTPMPVLASLRRLASSGKIRPGTLRVRFVGDFDAPGLAACKPVFDELAPLVAVEYENRVVPRDEARRELGSADFLLLADNNALNAGYTVPAKLYEYIQVGRPVLALTAADSPVERILCQAGIPFVALHPGLSPSDVDQRILHFLSLPADPVPPSDAFLQNFNGRSQTGILASLFDSLRAGAAR